MRCFRLVSALAALVAVSLSAPIAAPLAVSAQGTICERYSAALGVTQDALITAVVARAVLGTTQYNADLNLSNGTRGITLNTVEGIVFVPELTIFFNGSYPYDLNLNKTAGAPAGALLNRNFIASYLATQGGAVYEGDNGTPGSLFMELAGKLVAFFGAGFGCSPAITGSTTNIKTMKAAHLGMNVTKAIFNSFNTQVAKSFTSFGGNVTDTATAGSLLASFGRGAGDAEICSESTCDLVASNTPASGSSSSSTGPASGSRSSSSSSTGTVTPRGSSSTGAGTSSGAVVVPSMAVALVAIIASLAL